MRKEKLIWSAEKRSVRDLRHWKENPRKISKDGFKKLLERIQLRGFHDVIKVDKENQIILVRGAIPGTSGAMVVVEQTSRSLKHKKAPQAHKVEKKAAAKKPAGKAPIAPATKKA